MAIARKPFKLTYHDYALIPEEKRVELIDRDFLMSPAPSTRHQRVLTEIFARLYQWVKEKDLGIVFVAPTDVKLSEHDVVQPDILFIAKKHMGIIRKPHIDGPPDLVIEIVSPDHPERDTDVKRHLYSKFGIQEYWIVEPESETITLLAFGESSLEVKQAYPPGSILESTVVADLKLSTREIFAE